MGACPPGLGEWGPSAVGAEEPEEGALVGAFTGAGRSLLARVSEDVHAIGIGICVVVCPPERGGPSSGAGRGAVGDLSAVGAPAAVAVLVFGHGGACSEGRCARGLLSSRSDAAGRWTAPGWGSSSCHSYPS